MPNITEADPLAMAAEHRSERTHQTSGESGSLLVSGIEATKILSRNSNGVVTAPVAVPQGTLISGTSFNVTTSDDLPHFKPMICIDNGFITGGSTSEDIKAANTLIQSSLSPPVTEHNGDTNPDPATSTRMSYRWADAANLPVLPIRCKNTSAELHKLKLGSGRRGKCIKCGLSWYTPSEFEALCGRASSRDWKRSIKYGGQSIQTLIDKGVLSPHAISCTCGACCEDPSVSSPIRFFKPYKRRQRKNTDEMERKKPKMKHTSPIGEAEIDDAHQNSNSNSKEAWHTVAEDLEGNPDYHMLTTSDENPDSMSVAPDLTSVVKRLDQLGDTLMRVAGDLKLCVEEVRAMGLRHMQMERAAGLHAAAHPDSKRCANCSSEAAAECSLCRRTPYCSTFCQKKDWPSHQLECLRSVPGLQADNTETQSIMVIVDGQPHVN